MSTDPLTFKAQRPWYFRPFLSFAELEFDGYSIAISGPPEATITLESLLDFVEFRQRPWGGTLTIRSTQQIRIGFLNKNQAFFLSLKINKAFTPILEHRILAYHEKFDKLANKIFLRDSSVVRLQKTADVLLDNFNRSRSTWIKFLPSITISFLEEIFRLSPLRNRAEELRETYISSALEKERTFFDSVERNPLTENQRLACLRNNDRNLVLAAAGTGKTSVIIAKTIHLIESGQAKPNEILILAYNRSAAAELRQRFLERSHLDGASEADLPNIQTFHALGRDILKQSGDDAYLSIFAEDDLKFLIWVTEWLKEHISSSAESLSNFLKILYEPVNPFKFQHVEDYEAYVRDNELRALTGDKVKSYQELIIANWFYQHSVKFEYEPQYRTKRRIKEGVDYRPDFFLPDIDVYLEHFGIDRAGNTRIGIDKNKYAEEMRLKRALHREQGTTLLETFHYDWVEENLEIKLKEKVLAAGGILEPISKEKLFEALNDSGHISEKAKILLDCLKAIRVEGLKDDQILSRLADRNVGNKEIWAEVLIKVHGDYRAKLSAQNSIDFDDMISSATAKIGSGDFVPKWRHVLVDEFQDISQARASFLNSLITAETNPTLTAVGDDWQAIYRFSGGKLELITRFDEKFGPSTRTVLDKTFRYNSSIAHVAGTFITENPEQFSKEIETDKIAKETQVYLLDQGGIDGSNLPQKVERVVRKIRENDPKGSITILARYNYILEACRRQLRSASGENINFWTFHSSKGREADYCICVGFFMGASGFPNYKLDAVVKEALLPLPDNFKHSEERRLLYVALTRAKNKSYLIADAMSPSEFIIELLSPKYGLEIVSEKFQKTYRQIFKCPKCTGGFFQMRTGKFGDFYSCSSGYSCDANPRKCGKCGAPSIDGRNESKCNNPGCQNSIKICTVCGRPMRLREGRFGRFWGCSGYGLKKDRCKNTEKFRT